MHPRERLKRLSKNYLIRNQIDKKIFPQILPQKKLIQKNKNQRKDIEYIKKVPLHRRERLKCKKRIKQEPEIQYVKTVPQHPRDRLTRRLKNKSANIICDEEFLKEFLYFNRKIKVNKTDKIKRREAIIYKIVKQIPSDNDKWYVKYNRDSDTIYVGKEDKRQIIVIESSEEETKNRRKRIRKGTNNTDEINEIIPKKRIKAKRVVYPTDTLLALGKIKTERKKTKKEKT